MITLWKRAICEQVCRGQKGCTSDFPVKTQLKTGFYSSCPSESVRPDPHNTIIWYNCSSWCIQFGHQRPKEVLQHSRANRWQKLYVLLIVNCIRQGEQSCVTIVSCRVRVRVRNTRNTLKISLHKNGFKCANFGRENRASRQFEKNTRQNVFWDGTSWKTQNMSQNQDERI